MTTFTTIEQTVEALYVGYFGRAGDPLGTTYWEDQILLGHSTWLQEAASFSIQPESQAKYQFLATDQPGAAITVGGVPTFQNLYTFINSVYMDLFNRPVDSSGLAYWTGQLVAHLGDPTALGEFILNVISGATPGGQDDLTLTNKVNVATFITNEVTQAGLTWTGALSTESEVLIAATTSAPGSVAAEDAAWHAFELQFFATPAQTLTIGQDTIVGTQFGNNVFNAPLVAPAGGQLTSQPTLTSADSITAFGIGNVLNATFLQNHDVTVRSLNIVNVQTWNIDLAGTGDGTITLTGDGPGGSNQIIGLRVLNVNFDEGTGCLIVGDNSSPIQEPNGADGFTINVSDATGDGLFLHQYFNGEVGSNIHWNSPCVDVDIAAAAFTGHDTIHVTANIVGGFPQYNGSYVIPVPILDRGSNLDDYDPNWLGYLADAFSISAGASAGNLNAALGPLGGAVGFANWVVASTGAKAVGTLNIIALGGEGSTSAQTITLTDDGSNTMLFATAVSDSLSTDWENVTTVNLAGTSGFVTITGLETNVQEVSGGFLDNSSDPLTAANFLSNFQYYDGGGLLASDTVALTSIAGGAGNSFYDLSSLARPTPTTTTVVTIDGGHSTAGNSEVAFNNAVITALVPAGDVPPIAITHIQVLDDVSSIGSITVPDLNPDGSLGTAILENGGEAQGGLINMNNWAGLLPLNVPYALLAEGSPTDVSSYTLGGPVPSGLPFTTLPAGITAASSIATDLQNGVVPAGFQVLQLLNAEGSTQTVLGAKLVIENGPVNFAINMQDTADGILTPATFVVTPEYVGADVLSSTWTLVQATPAVWTGFDITITEGQPPSPTSPTIVNFANTLVLFVSDDGVQLTQTTLEPTSLAGSIPTIGAPVNSGTALYVPELTIDNYSTVDIVLPTESVGTPNPQHDPALQNYVILGGQDPLAAPGGIPNGGGFNVTPVVTVNNAVVNFYDNNADNGGSPPGGEDDLVLGFTNFTGTLTPAYIGLTTVAIDTAALDFSTTINDFSTGSLEIGATNVTNLNAQSTSHLIMDLPATFPLEGAGGITVNGSLIGQNLEQGTSGPVVLDPAANGHNPTGGDIFAVLESFSPTANHGGWANDTLTGGDGFGSYTISSVGGAPGSVTFTTGVSNGTFSHATETLGALTVPTPVLNDHNGPGNTGDNFFGEGGNDIVNIAAGEVGSANTLVDVPSSSGSILTSVGHAFDNESTVWVGFYDVCNSGGANYGGNPVGPDWGVGTVYDQAITDLSPVNSGEETFVDGYGNTGKDANDPTSTSSSPVVTINGFHFGTGNTVGTNAGDTIVFGVADWAVTPTGTTTNIDNPTTGADVLGTVEGLVESDGHTPMPVGFATYADVGTGGAFASTTGLPGGGAVKVVEDSIGGSYTGAAALQNALSNHSTSFYLADGGMPANHEADILVAYQLAPTVSNPGGAIAIADVTLTNTGTTGLLGPLDVAQLHPVVHDLVHINTTTGFVGVASFFAHNIDFVG